MPHESPLSCIRIFPVYNNCKGFSDNHPIIVLWWFTVWPSLTFFKKTISKINDCSTKFLLDCRKKDSPIITTAWQLHTWQSSDTIRQVQNSLMPSPSAFSKFGSSILKFFKHPQFFRYTQNNFGILKS